MPLLLVRPGGAKRGWLPILMKYYTGKLVQCSQRSNFMMQSFQLLQPILTEKTKIWVCKSILSRGPIIEGGNSIGRGERWLLLSILLKYYIAKAAQQTMQCKVTFVEVVLLPNIKEKQWSGFAQVVFFCTALLAFIEFYFVKLLHCISGQCEIYACSVFSLFCLPLDFSVRLIAHMQSIWKSLLG